MQYITISVENLKCGGCSSSIKTALKRIKGVEQVTVDTTQKNIRIACAETVERPTLTTMLHQLGYPEVGTVQGLGALTTQLKSFVSCAIGRVGGDNL